jgi:hypothetical protein
MRQHFSDAKAVRRGLPRRVIGGKFAHEIAQDFRSRLQHIEAGKFIVVDHVSSTSNSRPFSGSVRTRISVRRGHQLGKAVAPFD